MIHPDTLEKIPFLKLRLCTYCWTPPQNGTILIDYYAWPFFPPTNIIKQDVNIFKRWEHWRRTETLDFIKLHPQDSFPVIYKCFSAAIGRRRTPRNVPIGHVRRRTLWWVLSDRLSWKLWCLPARSCLRPSSSYGRRGGGGGKPHRGIQPLRKRSRLEGHKYRLKWIYLTSVPYLLQVFHNTLLYSLNI